MKRYSILQPLYLSFYSRDLYRDVRKHWNGTGFLYLLLLLAITWVPVMVMVHRGIGEAVRREAPPYIEQVPTITILRGEVSIDRPVPYTISEPDSGIPLVVIDTSGKISSLEQTDAPVLLTKNKFMYQQKHKAETRIYDLAGVEAFTLDRALVQKFVDLVRNYFALLAYPVALAASFVYRILQMLLYAVVGLLFAHVLKSALDYVTLLRLASVAITPVIILSMLRWITGIPVPAFGLLCFLVAMGYLYVAVKANTEPDAPETPAS